MTTLVVPAASLEEMADFWDTHSLADYDDETYEVEMTFDPTARRTWIGIEPDVLDKEAVKIAYLLNFSG